MTPDHAAIENRDGMHADLGAKLRELGLTVNPLPTISEPNVKTFRRQISRLRSPVLFKGLIENWPSRMHWTPDRLAECHGEATITALMDLPCTGVFFERDQATYEKQTSFRDFLSLIQQQDLRNPCYLAYQPADELFPARDHDFEGLLGSFNSDPDTRVWIGSAGTRSMLHSDLKDNLFCQIWGRKYVILLPWENSISAYPCPDNVVNSQLDLANLDIERYPRIRATQLFAGVVSPGDLLFIPRGCWHDIRSLSPSISLNHWFGESLGLKDYLHLIVKLGPECWWATARNFIRKGVLAEQEATTFFFSPPSTGKRLYDAIRWGNFSRENDPTLDRNSID